MGRYAYGNPPRIAQWNLARLAETLLPLLADRGADPYALDLKPDHLEPTDARHESSTIISPNGQRRGVVPTIEFTRPRARGR